MLSPHPSSVVSELDRRSLLIAFLVLVLFCLVSVLSVLLLWVLSFCLLWFCNEIVTAAGLCAGPIPVHCCGLQPDGGYMYALIR